MPIKKAYAGFDELLALTENLLRTILAESIGSTAVTVAGGCLSADSGSDDTEADADADAGVVVDFGPVFRQISVVPALEEALGAALPDLEDGDAAVPVLLQMCAGAGVGTGPPHTVPALMDRLIGHVLEPMCIQPTFLCGRELILFLDRFPRTCRSHLPSRTRRVTCSTSRPCVWDAARSLRPDVLANPRLQVPPPAGHEPAREGRPDPAGACGAV